MLNKCLVTTIPSITLGPKESGVESLLPKPTTSTGLFNKSFFFKIFLISFVITVIAFSLLSISVTSLK